MTSTLRIIGSACVSPTGTGRGATSSVSATSSSRVSARRASFLSVPRRAPARSVTVRASNESSDDPVETSEESATRKISRRGAILNVATLAISLPLWRDVLHDLGYLHGDEDEPAELPAPPPGSGFDTATFAGGCFWCMEKPFDILPGVVATTSGYAGPPDAMKSPTYHQVGAGGTGHREAVQILFDPNTVSYETLLDVYWHQIDPTTGDRMFLDSGEQYSSAIFPKDEKQRVAAEASLRDLAERNVFPAKIETKIIDFSESRFYPAEKYHQDYYRKNSARYGFYRSLSGRDEFVQSVWGVDAWAKYTGHNEK